MTGTVTEKPSWHLIKSHKRVLIGTSAVILLPVIVGLILWARLPDSVAIHFDAQSQPDEWGSKPLAVFGIPAWILAMHWLAVVATCTDRRNQGIPPQLLRLLLWMCPTLSVVLCILTYANALGATVNIGIPIMLYMGVLFLFMGNYMPKCKPNRSVGIRVRWTMTDGENWRRTHRLAGWSMTIGGLLILLTACLCLPWLFFSILAAALLVPFLYSFLYHLQSARQAGQGK